MTLWVKLTDFPIWVRNHITKRKHPENQLSRDEQIQDTAGLEPMIKLTASSSSLLCLLARSLVVFDFTFAFAVALGCLVGSTW